MKISQRPPSKLQDLKRRIATAQQKNAARKEHDQSTPRDSLERSSASSFSLTPNSMFSLGMAALVGSAGSFSGMSTGGLSMALATACIPGAAVLGTFLGSKLTDQLGEAKGNAAMLGMGAGTLAGVGLTALTYSAAFPGLAGVLGVCGAMSGVLAAGLMLRN